MKPKTARSGLSFYVILLLIAIAFATIIPSFTRAPSISLSTVIQQIQAGNVKGGVMVNGYSIELEFKEAVQTITKVKKTVSPYWLPRLQEILEQAKADGKLSDYDYNEPTDLSFLVNIILLVMMFGSIGLFIWFTYNRQSGEGKTAINFGRSRAKLSDPSKNPITFKDVAGADEEKEELKEIVDFLKNPKKYADLGAKIPRGILLIGPPGTGKTLLAKAVAGEAGVPFYSISGSDFVEMFVGVGASRVRDLFETAKKNGPAIVFIDEIDAVGRHRGAGMGGGHDEREQTLNQLLVEMDGFGPNQDVIIMAATNRPDILDPALLRPGRFDRRVTVMRPDIRGREEILKVHSRNKPMDPTINLNEIARVTPGFTGADLANLLNEAALMAARRGDTMIRYTDITESVFKVMIGPEKKSRLMNEKERRLTAYHEAGHAIVLRIVSETDKVERISIIPAGMAGGYTAHKPHEDMYYTTRRQLVHSIMISLAGRASEEIVFGEISTGAASDLQQCNAIARDMITKYGMSDKLGNLVFGSQEEVFLGKDYGHIQNFSEKLASIIDEEIKQIIDSAYVATTTAIKEHRETLERLATRLLEKEKIEGPEFEEIYLETNPKAIDESTAADASSGMANPGEAKTPVVIDSAKTDVHEPG